MSKSAAFSVPLADLERGPKEVTWTISADWLRQTLADTDATPMGDAELEVELTKTGRDVVVRGQLRARVSMPCSRTLDPVEIPIAADVFLMLAQVQPPEAEGRSKGRERSGKRRADAARDGRQGEGKRPKQGWVDDPALSDDQAARDTFVGEQIVLDPFIREFILLELPMFPIRSDLPSDAPAAIGPPSPGTESALNGGQDRGAEPRRIDPRLAPLAEIRDRLKSQKE